MESNRDIEIASFLQILESANATSAQMSMFSSPMFLILLDFTRYVYEFIFREKVYLSEAHRVVEANARLARNCGTDDRVANTMSYFSTEIR